MDREVVAEQMAEGGGTEEMVRMENGDEWDSSGISVGPCAVLGLY